MAAFAAVENVFPPVPADTVVALGSWLAARGQGSAFWAFFATWVGNVAGAGAMYAVGWRHGTAWMHRRFPALADEKNERRLARASRQVRRGLTGAEPVHPGRAGDRAAVRRARCASRRSRRCSRSSLASGVWYGLVSYLAFRAGADWGALMATHHALRTLHRDRRRGGRGGGRARVVASSSSAPGLMADADARARRFLLQRFADYIALEQGLSPRTQEAYGRDLARFAEYADVKGVAAPLDITARTAARVRLPPQGPRTLARVASGATSRRCAPTSASSPATASSCATRASGSRRRSGGASSPTCSPSTRSQRLLAAPTLDDPHGLPRPGAARARVRRRPARLRVDHARRAGPAARGGARARLRQGEQGAARADRPVAPSAPSRSTCGSSGRVSRRARGRESSSSTRADGR